MTVIMSLPFVKEILQIIEASEVFLLQNLMFIFARLIVDERLRMFGEDEVDRP